MQPPMIYQNVNMATNYPKISTMAPMQHEVDWFYGRESWKIFDSRRCNLIENLMQHNTQQEFEMVYRDSKCIVNFRTMTMYDTGEEVLYKLRRETPICSKLVRLGQGTWSFYNGLTWIQYDKYLIQQLEERLKQGEINFSIYIDGKEYTFDLDQNVQVCDVVLPLGQGDRKIITRQWLTLQELQDIARMKKAQETVYIQERKKLEESVKQEMVQKKAMHHQMKQQQKQMWNEWKKQQQRSQQPQGMMPTQIPTLLPLQNQQFDLFQLLPKVTDTDDTQTQSQQQIHHLPYFSQQSSISPQIYPAQTHQFSNVQQQQQQ